MKINEKEGKFCIPTQSAKLNKNSLFIFILGGDVLDNEKG